MTNLSIFLAGITQMIYLRFLKNCYNYRSRLNKLNKFEVWQLKLSRQFDIFSDTRKRHSHSFALSHMRMSLYLR